MLPKRVLFFLLTLGLFIGYALMSPAMHWANLEAININTTPSTSPYGYKALFFLMQRIQNQPVSLWEHSMMNLPLDQPKTIWFIEPGEDMFFDGDAYSQQMQALVKNGYHFVFVLNQDSMVIGDKREAKNTINVIDYLNQWYHLSLYTQGVPLKASKTFAVNSHFNSRTIKTLTYEKPTPKQLAYQDQILVNNGVESVYSQPDPTFLYFDPHSEENAKVLLATDDGNPLALSFPIGKGSITIFPNSVFFANDQLDKGDNAALAAAIQEMFPPQPILFEVYSSGFNANKDMITYLATGKGLALLVTLILFAVLFCLWLVNQPLRRIETEKASDERHFTQETFVAALANHYLSTRKWEPLYQKLLAHFQSELDRRYPRYSRSEQLMAIAQNPFIEVSLETLESLFDSKPISSSEAFVHKSQTLLEIQSKVFHHEYSQPNIQPYSTASIRY